MSYFTEVFEEAVELLEGKHDPDHPESYNMKRASDMGRKFDDKRKKQREDLDNAHKRNGRLNSAYSDAATHIPYTDTAPSKYREKINKDHDNLSDSVHDANRTASKYDDNTFNGSTNAVNAANKLAHKQYEQMAKKYGRGFDRRY